MKPKVILQKFDNNTWSWKLYGGRGDVTFSSPFLFQSKTATINNVHLTRANLILACKYPSFSIIKMKEAIPNGE